MPNWALPLGIPLGLRCLPDPNAWFMGWFTVGFTARSSMLEIFNLVVASPVHIKHSRESMMNVGDNKKTYDKVV